MYWEYSWLVPIVPIILIPFALFLGKKLPKEGAEIGIAGALFSLILSILVSIEYLYKPNPQNLDLISWIILKGKENVNISITMRIDPLSIIMMDLISTIATLIMVYSIGYMGEEEGQPRYYAEMLLFVGTMLMIVSAGDLLTLFIGWEGVGVSSYLLIGFWYKRPPAASAAKKAFIVTKTGDVFFTAGIAMLFAKFNSLNIIYILQNIQTLDPKTRFLVGLFMFIGAIGKSAQFPLLAWLWDAMEGPTTVSAILHSSTMVKAGVFLVARMLPLIVLCPKLMLTIAYVGAFTAFIAATLAFVEMDIKRVLAYSTISQIGYMMAALGLGGLTAGILHLISHAFFKALLFLCAGSVVHTLHKIIHDPWKVRDMRYMGGLKDRMKITYYTSLIGALALSGIIPLSGFWSKDLVIEVASLRGDIFIYWTLVLTALLTAFYIFRLVILTFHGKFRATEHQEDINKIAESPRVMTWPLIILASLTVLLGFIMPIFTSNFTTFLESTYSGLNISFEEGIAKASFSPCIAGFTLNQAWALSLPLALLGIGIAYGVYIRGIIDLDVITKNPVTRAIYKLLERKYFIDDVYLILSEKITYKGISRFLSWFDAHIIDGIVNGIGRFFKVLGRGLRGIQVGIIEDYLLLFALGVIMVLLFGIFLLSYLNIIILW